MEQSIWLEVHQITKQWEVGFSGMDDSVTDALLVAKVGDQKLIQLLGQTHDILIALGIIYVFDI